MGVFFAMWVTYRILQAAAQVVWFAVYWLVMLVLVMPVRSAYRWHERRTAVEDQPWPPHRVVN